MEIMKLTGHSFPVDSETFKLKLILDADLLQYKEEITEIADGADKQLSIEKKLSSLKNKWAAEALTFAAYKTRPTPVLKGFGLVVEELEDSQLQLQTMLSMKHVAPFKSQVQVCVILFADQHPFRPPSSSSILLACLCVLMISLSNSATHQIRTGPPLYPFRLRRYAR